MTRNAFAACALLTALLIACAGVLASAAAPSTVASLLALSFLPYAGLLLAPAPQGARAARALLALSALAGAVLVLQPSVLSDDVHRYRWDARVTLSGIDPYAHAPDSPRLAQLRDDDWERINHREIPTIYPPLAQLLFALGFAPGVWLSLSPAASIALFKLMALLLHLTSAALVLSLSAARGQPQVQATRAMALLALNPLALSEAALGGHVDVALGLGALLLAAALVAPPRAPAAAVLMGLLSGLKLVGIALSPLLLRRGLGWSALALLLSLAALVPLLRAGHGDAGAVSGVGHYAQRWRGNEGAFVVLDGAARWLVDGLADAAGSAGPAVGDQEVALPLLAPLLAGAVGGALDPSSALRAERKQPRAPGVFDRAHLAGLIARAVAAGLVLALALGLGLRAGPGSDSDSGSGVVDGALAVRSVLLAVLLLAPQLHPWYLLWLLPLEVTVGRRAGLVWSAVVLVAYAPLDGWLLARSWQEPTLAGPLQLGLVLGAVALEQWWCRRRPQLAASAR